ncbi:hypothetical protein ABPG72_021069 [Tetrahymena utriculariae]
MTNLQVQTNLPPIAKGMNANTNSNEKLNPFDGINFEIPISQNSTKNSPSISQNQNRSQDMLKQNKPAAQQNQQPDNFSSKKIQKRSSNNVCKIQNEMKNLSGKHNIQRQEFQREEENYQLSPQLNKDYQKFTEKKQNTNLNQQENNSRGLNGKDKQVKQPFIPYKYRKSSHPSVNSSNYDQNNFYYNTKGYLQNESNNYAADFIVNNSDEEEVSKEEYRDPILNVQKHRKEFGINIAQKMNRFYNIKALSNKSQQLQLAFDNANNLFIVDQRDDNYLSQTVMNLNMDMSTRKHQSQDILQQIIQEKRDTINQSEGLCHSITTNGKESLLSQLSKKPQLKSQMQMNNQSSLMKPKYMLYHNFNSHQISPKSNVNAQIINSPISQNSNNQKANNNKNYNTGFSTAIFKNNLNNFVMPKNCNNFLNPPSPASQFDKFTFKKPEVPLVNTRKALFKYTNSKKLVKSNTEGNFSSSFNYKNQSQYSNENLKTNTEGGCFQKINDLFHNIKQLNACQQFNQPQIMTAKNQLKQQPQKIEYFSKSGLQTQKQPYFEQDINLSESLKTWKVKQFNDDFNKISKESKKSYYRGQLNNKFDSKNQTAYFTTNGMYGFFCSKNEEVATIDQEKENQQKSKIDDDKRESCQNSRQQKQDKNIDSDINQLTGFQNQQSEIQSSKTPRKQNYSNLKEIVLQKEEANQQAAQPNEVEMQNKEQSIRQNQFSVEIEPTKKNDDSTQESQTQADSLKISFQKNKIESGKKDVSNIKANFNKNIQDFMIGNIKQNSQKSTNEKKGSNTAREIYQNTSEDDEITGWISRKKSDNLSQHRPSFSSYCQSKKIIQFRKNINLSNTNSISQNNQQDSYKNLYGSNLMLTLPQSQNGANSSQSIPKSNQSNNNIQNSSHSIGANSNNQTREQNNNHKDPNLISKITEHGESQDYSLDNSNFIQNRMAGFMTRDKNDDDEDLKNYLHLQNIIPSQIK